MTQRQRSRRELILTHAGELFGRHGFHSVGVNEIGAAAGVTGPAIYRHFPNKDALLAAVFDRVSTLMLANAHRALDEAGTPTERLERLIANHVDFALDNTSLLQLFVYEQRNLTDLERRRVQQRLREFVQIWVDVLKYLRPEYDSEELKTAVYSSLWVITSIGYYHSRLDRRRLSDLLNSMAMAALMTAGSPGSIQP